MTLPADRSYPIADLRSLLRERVGLELSPVELAEILWLALQRSQGTTDQQIARKSPELPSKAKQLRQPPSPTEIETDQTSPATASLVTEPLQPPGEGQAETGAQTPATALSVSIPEAVALRNRRAIAKSLRPLMRKVDSKLRQEIDEEATVIRIAEAQTWRTGASPESNRWFWSPVVRPEPERWLELAIVIEVTNLLEVWRDPIAEFQHLMERHGAFRDVRTWHLQPNEASEPQLFSKTARGLKSKPRSPKELLDAGGRRLILLLSDCTSKAWRSGNVPQLLKLWSRENPVTIVQLLPEHYWDRSALGLGYPVALKSRLPGALSRDWKLEGRTPRRRQRVLAAGLKVPVVTMQPASLGKWAKALTAIGEQKTTGMVLDLNAFQANDAASSKVESLGAMQKAKQLVRRFRATASAKAQELADMMAVLPVNWSVIRLLQKNLRFPGDDPTQETGALYLAEIFLSGLLRPAPMNLGSTPNQATSQRYDFVEGVRDVLLGTIPISEAQAIGEEVAEAIFKKLPREVQERVNEDIKRRFGEALSYFEAFLIPDLPWGKDAKAEIFPFAQVTSQVLKRWGGEYVELAELLEGSQLEPLIPIPLPSDWPAIQRFEFEAAEVEVGSGLQGETALEPFEFEMATLRFVQKQNLWERLRGKTHQKIEIVKARRQGIRWVEALDQGLGLEMVQIPAGRFLMGSPENEAGRSRDEGPQHQVRVSEFLMGKYLVTQAQWRAVAALPQVNRELKLEPSDFKGDEWPMEQVSWVEAVEFCDRLTKLTGRQYRLPSEAEWEYACRAGTTTPFCFGETITRDLANYDGNYAYGGGPKGVYRKKTAIVGNFPANGFGLYDMHGNVWEWCLDHWHENYEGAPVDGTAWLSSDESAMRLLRGGSWYDVPENCRSALRSRNDPDNQLNLIGFRVVCSPPRDLR